MEDPARAAAVAAMWDHLDEHPVRDLFEDPLRWRAFRGAQRGLIEGHNTTAWRTPKGDLVRDWTERARLYGLALDRYAAELGRPDRLRHERVPGVDVQLARWVIPNQLDPFPQRQSTAKAGTEHASIAAKGAAAREEPGGTRILREGGSRQLTLAGQVEIAAADEAVARAEALARWADEHPDAAEEARVLTRRELHLAEDGSADATASRWMWRGVHDKHLLNLMRQAEAPAS
jgi:hypothetical protein